MLTTARFLGPLLVCLAALAACVSLYASGEDRILDVVRIDLPQGGIHGNPEFFAQPISMNAEGALAYEGKGIAEDQLEAIFAQQQKDGLIGPALIIDPQTPFKLILPILPAFSEQQDFEFDWEGQVPPIPRADFARLDAFIAEGFAGKVTENEVGLRVGYSADADQCVLVLDDKEIASEEAYELSFERLDEIVQREGGAEAVLNNPDLLYSLVARIQSGADTPWRCFGGAVLAVKNAGWPAIAFEVVADQ